MHMITNLTAKELSIKNELLAFLEKANNLQTNYTQIKLVLICMIFHNRSEDRILLRQESPSERTRYLKELINEISFKFSCELFNEDANWQDEEIIYGAIELVETLTPSPEHLFNAIRQISYSKNTRIRSRYNHAIIAPIIKMMINDISNVWLYDEYADLGEMTTLFGDGQYFLNEPNQDKYLILFLMNQLVPSLSISNVNPLKSTVNNDYNIYISLPTIQMLSPEEIEDWKKTNLIPNPKLSKFASAAVHLQKALKFLNLLSANEGMPQNKLAFVLTNASFLAKTGYDQKVRSRLLKDDFLKAIIHLPNEVSSEHLYIIVLSNQSNLNIEFYNLRTGFALNQSGEISLSDGQLQKIELTEIKKHPKKSFIVDDYQNDVNVSNKGRMSGSTYQQLEEASQAFYESDGKLKGLLNKLNF